jgi:hypothetical protein
VSIELGFRDLMVNANLGTFEATSGWSIHIGKMPKTPDTAILITQGPGLSPNPKWLLDYPTVQVRVRGSQGSYESARAKAKDIKDLFLGFSSADVNGDRWVSITMLSDIAFLGYDDNERPEFSINFLMIVEPATSVLTNRSAL